MGSIKYFVIICLLLAGNAQAATVVGQAKFTSYSTNRQTEIVALQTGKLSTTGSAANLTGFPTLNQNTSGTAAIATTSTITDDVSTATPVYPNWVAAAGNSAEKISTTKLSFVPSTGILTATGFAGPLTGTASAATLAASSSAVAVTTDNTATTYYPHFGLAAGAGRTVFVDDTTTPLSYVPSTGTLTASNFSGIHSAGSIASGVTGTTQAVSINNTTLATTAFTRLYAQPIYATATALTPSAAITWTPVLGTNIYTLTPNATGTIAMGTIPAACVGSIVRLVITTSGTTSYTITASTNLLMQGTLATGAVTAKTYIISFLIQSATSVKEISRTTAM